ncbi:hypothetical protein H8356DRAFT_1085069 [Neocallimastix lanati (nom. inval.)]|uniref:Uncharacterized protein n=1 Tax=Neocallimastix californiae TaxID=1754190 RepID=A0A1Y2F4P1_9FUNG|nr:hypothetical protein H8356DRAFT_1085069 [Neocallimastix sp. JGI-2020a]ORY78296.1 hypothetical protein LY90DRAFT_501061 [Neocallimastix californiae]|eukprot:ORY78296.1 hypothetical protein LY90DRAFT_501061 [Neocallimastix californiae]
MVNHANFKGRNFLLTVNEASLEYYQDIIPYLTNISQFQYLLCCEHVGQPHKHYPIFVHYNNTKKLRVARLYGCHVEKCFGSAQQNINYVKAEDPKHREEGIESVLIDEIGEAKLKGGVWSVGGLTELDNPDELPAQLYNTYNKIKGEKSKRLSLGNWRKNVKLYYIQGPSAIRKSNNAEEIIKDWYVDKGVEDENEMFFELKYDGSFYSGVNIEYSSEVAVFNDFRAGVMKPEEFISVIDYCVHNLNIKGTEAKNNYKLIIVTLVQKLNSIEMWKILKEENNGNVE